MTTSFNVSSEERPSLDPVTDAPGFTLVDLTGKSHNLEDYRGRVVIVNFWASWCAPCVREMPALERLQHKMADWDGRILAINFGESRKRVDRFLRRNPTGLIILLDHLSASAVEWQVNSLPTSFVIDPAGRIVERLVGEQPWDSPELIELPAKYR